MLQSNVVQISENIASEFSEVPAHCGGIMQIDLDAIKHNYEFIRSHLSESRCAAVVKADAYGLGAIQVSKALESIGCKDFFVATPDEGFELSSALNKDANIYILNGLYPGSEGYLTEHNLIPVLNSVSQILTWQNHAKKVGRDLPAIIHIDTGMWRAGLPMDEVDILHAQPERLNHIDIICYLSHLACSEQPNHQKNRQQLNRLKEALDKLPTKPVSLSNSHGVLLGADYHFDLLRPGRILYGLGSRTPLTQGIRPGVSLYAKLLQIRDVAKGEAIGYDSTFVVEEDMKVATIGIGYADGIMRTLTNNGLVYIQGQPAPIVGRVSMDLITIDVTSIDPTHLEVGSWAEVIGDHISADELARMAGTNSREITSNLGQRYHRIYKGA